MSKVPLFALRRSLKENGAEATLSILEYARDGTIPYMTVPMLPRIHYLTRPEHVHELLVKHGDEAEKWELTARIARSTFGNGILFSNGAVWKRQRKLMQPVFHHARVKAFAERMTAIAGSHLDGWKGGMPLDLSAEMHRITLKIVVDTLFSSDVAGDADEISEAIDDIGKGFAAQAGSILLALMPDWVPLPSLRRKSRGARNFNRILRRLIDERRAIGEAYSPQDLLSALMFSKDPDTGEQMDDEQLRGELLTLYVAGHDTTAWLLSWTLAYLAQNPHVTERLRAEVQSLDGRVPTVEDLGRLPYSKMVLQETLRMRPPAWFIQRQAHETLEIDGISFPAKTIFMIAIYALHHNPEVFADPFVFRPERWENDAEKSLPKGAYLPFAQGQRICIGNGFAMMEAQLLLNLLIQRFEFKLLDTPEMVRGTALILGFDRPVRMLVTPR